MALLNFKPRFSPFILDGRKQHTIRKVRKDSRVPKFGEICHCFEGLRTKRHRLLGRWPCVKVETITVSNVPVNPPFLSVHVEGLALSVDECERLARQDGFENFADMEQYWRNEKGRLPFTGHIIHWKWDDAKQIVGDRDGGRRRQGGRGPGSRSHRRRSSRMGA